MSLLNFFYTLLILPIESIIELVFNLALNKFSRLGTGGAVVFVSIVVNFLALPLYNIADALQLKERNIQKKMQDKIRRIKMAFKGDERFMMLSAYYRMNNYNPVYSLRSAFSILIEIPFFIAAYHYLSHCDVLKDSSFLFLKDLGQPDSLIVIGGFAVNILPIVMTLINCISGYVYSKDAPLKEKIQIYVLAAIFLVLLYQSPSGLVFYWILNNLFSLVKNAVQRYCKKPSRIVFICIIFACLFVCMFYTFFKPNTDIKKKIVIYAATVFMFFIPLLLKYYLLWFEHIRQTFNDNRISYFFVFFFGAISIAALCGAVLPSSMIRTSPAEFSFFGNTDNPLSYISYSVILGMGLFVVWPLAIYLMFDDRVKYALVYIFGAGAILSLCNVFVFRHKYGTVSIFCVLDSPDILSRFSPYLLAGPFFTVIITVAIFLFAEHKKRMYYISMAGIALCIGYAGLACKNVADIRHVYNKCKIQHSEQKDEDAVTELKPVFSLTKTGKNVFVLFLDRAIGVFAPYIFEEFPELNDVYSGWTFYPNTISFSDSTNKAAPALYGGYEYTPENINLRKNELLLQKHNESLLVMPKIFSDAGWDVVDYDPQYLNYSMGATDYSVLQNIRNTKAVAHLSVLLDKYRQDHLVMRKHTNIDLHIREALPRFAFIQTLVPVLRRIYYNDGQYFSSDLKDLHNFLSDECLENFAELYYLPDLTDFSSERNTYTIMHNMLPHCPSLLEPPFYTPAFYSVSADDNDKSDDFKCCYPYTPYNDRTDLKHYEVNAASLLQIAKWLKYLKENDCYDNTRIIIVSDHGFRDTVRQLADGFSVNADYAAYQPLLMFKDFNSQGRLKTDYTFMTNADTPALSVKDLPVSHINPFTGKSLAHEKTSGFNVYNANVIEGDWNPEFQKKNTLFNLYLKKAYHIGNDIFDESNWTPLNKWLGSHPDEKEKARQSGVKTDGGA